MLVSSGFAALLVGALSAVPAAAAAKGLHMVASPFITNSSLAGATVIAPGDMWAVGDIGTATGPFQTLAEHFNGTSWSVVPTPTLNASLAGVAGTAGNDVWAVGDQAQGSSVIPLIEQTAPSWSGTASPKLPKRSELTGVTAPATNNAWAVGSGAGSSNALVEHWDGTSWSIVSSPAFTGVNISGGAISADSATDVWALGGLATSSTTNENVSLHWDSTSWTQIPAAHLRFGGVRALAALSRPTCGPWAPAPGPACGSVPS